jgi:hypothetical protein
VLFSGQSSLGDVTAETAGGVLVALVLAKGLAYAISLAVGFRGGPIFPAVAIGVMVGVLGLHRAARLRRTPGWAHRHRHAADRCDRRRHGLARRVAAGPAGRVMTYPSRVRRRPAERLQAWIVTGPLGHLWSALADMTVIWVRYLAHRARRG